LVDVAEGTTQSPVPTAAAGHKPLRIQLWSYNYDPEPTGIGPVSRVLAEGLRDRGHQMDVVAAHPHYPIPRWGPCRRPYREVRNGIPVLRLPLWIGRASTSERYRQELSFMAAQFAALPALGRPDVLVATSPSFPALLPAMVNARARRIPWILWLQDILPDGAATTGLVKPGLVMAAARRLERAAYRDTDLVVVPSRSFTANLVRKGIPDSKVRLIHPPATRVPARPTSAPNAGPLRVLSIGNIGFSQGLAPLVASFERSAAMRERGVELVITGSGVAAEHLRKEIVSDRVRMLGVVDDERLDAELRQAHIALVGQHHGGAEFNIPSRLMNFMTYGLPVLAAVSPAGEVARIIRDSGGGWVVDSSEPDGFPTQLKELLDKPDELSERGRRAAEYAQRHFSQEGVAQRFEEAIEHAATPGSGRSAQA